MLFAFDTTFEKDTYLVCFLILQVFTRLNVPHVVTYTKVIICFFDNFWLLLVNNGGLEHNPDDLWQYSAIHVSIPQVVQENMRSQIVNGS